MILSISNPSGQEADVLVDEMQGAGNYETTWNAERLPAGLYVYRFGNGKYSQSGKILLAR